MMFMGRAWYEGSHHCGLCMTELTLRSGEAPSSPDIMDATDDLEVRVPAETQSALKFQMAIAAGLSHQSIWSKRCFGGF